MSTNDMRSGRTGSGRSVVTTSVASSLASALIAMSPRMKVVTKHSRPASVARLIAAAAIPAVNAVPSENFTPSRIANRQWVSSTCSHSVASTGSSSPVAGSRSTRDSVMFPATTLPTEKVGVSHGSSVGGSSVRAMTTPFDGVSVAPPAQPASVVARAPTATRLAVTAIRRP